MGQKEIFKMFCGNDEIRPAMLLPFNYKGKVCATDAHILIRCNESDCEFELDNPHKPLNTEAAFPSFDSERIVLNKLSDFDKFKIEDELVKQGKDIDCNECDGDGEVEWEYRHYNRTDECPVCNGSGFSSESRLIPNGKKTFNKYAYVSIDGVYFNVNLLVKIFEVHELLGGELISLNIVQKNKPAAFRLGIYEFLIMPVNHNEHDVELMKISFNI